MLILERKVTDEFADRFFIHIPRTGGTTFYEALAYKGMKEVGHFTFKEAKERNPDIDALKCTAIIRHPYDRAVSSYVHYVLTTSPDGTDWSSPVRLDIDMFRNFITNPPHAEWEDFLKDQTSYLEYEGSIVVQDLIRFEDFPATMVDRFGVPELEIIHKNKSPNRLILNNIVKKAIYEKYRRDFDNFGFEA